ncbi:MAG: NDP-sugar synthase [Chlorobiaceae bacterium]|nr:NDP-sugar synthase [Chlorobiaceae bacterium]NTV60254.1 NDP-sugar synthase [Chlorobiaceae bacterium]
MKAFVLGAGFGTRLRPLTDHLPKPLIPVLNVPALFYTFFLLKEAGITDIICNIHYHADAIRSFIGSTGLSGLDITFSVEEEILGTGGGLKKCENLLDESEFLLVNSDIITDIDFMALIRHHRRSGRPGTLVLHETPEAASIGYVGVEDGLVKDFRDLRGTGLVSSLIYTGTAVLGPEIFRFLETGFSSIVNTGFTGLIDNGGLGSCIHEGLWCDIGTINNYRKANLELTEKLTGLGDRMEQAIGMRPHLVSPEAEIGTDALVHNCVIGRNCRIGAGAAVTDSILLPGTTVRAHGTLKDSAADPYGIIPFQQAT